MGSDVRPELREWIEIVVDDNADDLLRYLRRRVTQPEDAADLLGRLLLTIWERGGRVPTTEVDARMWCFGIARNIVREHHRHAAKQLALAEGLRDHLRHHSSNRDGADATAEERMTAQKVRRAIGTLDERSRELVLLIHWDGFTIAAAARLIAMNESSARTRYGRALRRLERQLAEPPVPPFARPGLAQPDLAREAP